MKKSSWIVIAVGIIAVTAIILISITTNKYNTFVELRETVNSKEAAIDVALERRADLIPNLVNTVKGYVTHEEKIINSITTARENLLKANDIESKTTANNELTKAIDALMVIVENYPDLKANTNFINLQDELAGTENRIAVARNDYNNAAKEYNTAIKKFPGNIIATTFNFDNIDYFEIEEKKQSVPEVNFD